MGDAVRAVDPRADVRHRADHPGAVGVAVVDAALRGGRLADAAQLPGPRRRSRLVDGGAQQRVVRRPHHGRLGRAGLLAGGPVRAHQPARPAVPARLHPAAGDDPRAGADPRLGVDVLAVRLRHPADRHPHAVPGVVGPLQRAGHGDAGRRRGGAGRLPVRQRVAHVAGHRAGDGGAVGGRQPGAGAAHGDAAAAAAGDPQLVGDRVRPVARGARPAADPRQLVERRHDLDLPLRPLGQRGAVAAGARVGRGDAAAGDGDDHAVPPQPADGRRRPLRHDRQEHGRPPDRPRAGCAGR